MNEPAVRSRLLQLRRDLEAARNGRDLLERKREAIVRALAERVPRRDEQHRAAGHALARARTALREAQIELGRTLIDAAALAQPPLGALHVQEAAIVGVKVPRIEAPPAPYRPLYGPAGASDALDTAGAAFAAALPALLTLASEETTVRRLRAALARTARRLNAVDQLVLPAIARQITAIAAALEEDERDEAVRRKRWVELHKADGLQPMVG